MPSEESIRAARILVVDDEEANVLLLEQILAREGFINLETTTDPHRALAIYAERVPDVVLLDLRMPHVDGFAVLAHIRATTPPEVFVPVLMLTADVASDVRLRALSTGATDFITKPFDRVEVVLRVRNLVRTRLLHTALRAQNDVLEIRVRERTSHLWEAIQRLTESESATKEATEETIRCLAAASELRDAETGWHIERMSRYAALLAERSGLDAPQCELIRLASSMHDIGKIGIPDRILLKQGRLTLVEYEAIKEHPRIGHQILGDSKAEVLQIAATIALTHHERYDGGGYPDGLAKDDIPLVGRIAAVADVFDALTSNRVYRKAYALGKALDIMAEERGRRLDPVLFDTFVDSLDGVLEIMQNYADDPAPRRAPRMSQPGLP